MASAKPTFKTVTLFRSAKDSGERFAQVGVLPIGADGSEGSQDSCIYVCTRSPKGVHPILGFGGSFTEASAHVFSKMSTEKQEEILEAYFDPEKGLGYNLGRLPIASCDFGLGSWTCGDLQEGDMELSNFSIAKYHELILPLYKRAEVKRGSPFTIMASPWSPPPFMKTKRQFNGDGHLLPEYRAAWALHYAKFVQDMDKVGVTIWGISVQNEPEASQPWESCIYTAEEEVTFVRDFLGPTMAKHGLGSVKIMIWDHNRDGMLERAAAVYEDQETSKFVWGTAYHWYGDARFESWPSRSEINFEDRQQGCANIFELRDRRCFQNVRAVAEMYPDKHIIFSEGCQELAGRALDDVLGSWKMGERYGMNMISDFNSGTEGWIDWNLILDETGGPNHVGNTCIAPIICNTKTGEVLHQAAFWFMGHFSKYVKPGATRVISSTSRDVLEVVAFLNPDQSLVVVVMNQSDDDVDFWLKIPDGAVKTQATKRSINTFVLDSGVDLRGTKRPAS